MQPAFRRLSDELAIWREWATLADRDEAGWETDAPNWPTILALAKGLLHETDLQPLELTSLEFVFAISEEGEALADFLKDNLDQVPMRTIQELAKADDRTVRWQIFDSLGSDRESVELLRRGIEDPDSYVRRRAFLRLLSFEAPREDLVALAARDVDPVIRRVAAESRTTGR